MVMMNPPLCPYAFCSVNREAAGGWTGRSGAGPAAPVRQRGGAGEEVISAAEAADCV